METKTQPIDLTKCAKRVYPSGRYGAFHGHGCSKKATCVEDGKGYCTIHAPSYVTKKNEERSAKYEAKYRAKEETWAREAREKEERAAKLAVYPEMLALLERAADVLNGQRLGYMREQEANALVQEARALLARIAKG